MIKRIVVALLILVMMSATVITAQETDKEKIAIATAEKWLAVVDGGQYAESWREAASYFRTSVTQEQWKHSLTAVRKPLGRLLSRKMKDKKYLTSLPGAPDGEYLVIQFETSFANKKSAIETVTPMREKDGKWRVSGYYIN